jgi:hypothetical protein
MRENSAEIPTIICRDVNFPEILNRKKRRGKTGKKLRKKWGK